MRTGTANSLAVGSLFVRRGLLRCWPVRDQIAMAVRLEDPVEESLNTLRGIRDKVDADGDKDASSKFGMHWHTVGCI